MPKLLLFALALALSQLASAADFDLTLRYITTRADGVVLRRPYFANGAKRLALRLDSDLQVTGNATLLNLTFKGTAGASIRLQNSPVGVAKPFTAAVKEYAAVAESLLPAGATDAVLVAQNADPYPLNGWSSHQLIYSYAMTGQRLQTSVAFLNPDPAYQLIVHTTAREKDFNDIAGRAFAFLNSWYSLDAAEIADSN